eukprot:TRINITY_DN21279_c0_g1_i1.p1 TRINITY_DN21279_c0_g1~~TRINITY_DN21279_c0_g1_i1.p1  ORF type:complete len:165 (-),score=30.40 TRINITY_DN21279_c0_g1_i1:402-896(-)
MPRRAGFAFAEIAAAGEQRADASHFVPFKPGGCLVEASPVLSAMAGSLVAAAIMIPSIIHGPMLTLPPGLVLLLFELALMWKSFSFALSVGIAGFGLPLAHLLMLIPSGVLQFALPGIVGSSAGLCAAQLLGGMQSFGMSIKMVGFLAAFYCLCIPRVLKIGGF